MYFIKKIFLAISLTFVATGYITGASTTSDLNRESKEERAAVMNLSSSSSTLTGLVAPSLSAFDEGVEARKRDLVEELTREEARYLKEMLNYLGISEQEFENYKKKYKHEYEELAKEAVSEHKKADQIDGVDADLLKYLNKIIDAFKEKHGILNDIIIVQQNDPAKGLFETSHESIMFFNSAEYDKRVEAGDVSNQMYVRGGLIHELTHILHKDCYTVWLLNSVAYEKDILDDPKWKEKGDWYQNFIEKRADFGTVITFASPEDAMTLLNSLEDSLQDSLEQGYESGTGFHSSAAARAGYIENAISYIYPLIGVNC